MVLVAVFALATPTRVDLFADKLRRLHQQLRWVPYRTSPISVDLQERIEVFLPTIGNGTLP
jgi:hypothetical protein